MTKAELVTRVSEAVGDTKVATEQTLNAICDTAKEALLNGERISLGDIGMLDVKKRKARKGRNMKTGQEKVIPERVIAVFKPSKSLKKAMEAVQIN